MTTTKNNVAAQAGEPIPGGVFFSESRCDFLEAKSGGSMGGHFYDKWRDRADDFPDRDSARKSPTTEIAAQAGDEPMRAAFEALAVPDGLNVERGFKNGYRDADTRAAYRGFKLAQVSPRATADVERDADDEASRGSIEDFVAAADLVDAINACETKGEALGLVLMYRKAIRLATTKPGA